MKLNGSETEFWQLHEREQRIRRAQFFIETVLKLARFGEQKKVMSETQNFQWIRFVESIHGLPKEERQQKMLEYVSRHGNKVGVRHVEIVEVQNKGTEFLKKQKEQKS